MAVVDSGAVTFGGGFAFVGRERELHLLLAAIRRPPAVILIEGEAGIGKSRLVSEALSALAGDERRVLTGFCHPLREPFPFGPVVDALRTAGRWLPATGIPPTAGALAPLLPDLAHRLPPSPPRPEDDAAQRYQIVQAVRSVLTVIGPAVLVVEDLHWADEATRGLLLLLARDLPEHLSLVLTYRPEDLPSQTPVLGAAYRRPPGTNGTTIRLTPMTEHEVTDLARAALGGHATPALTAVLHRRSEGLPLTAEEDLITLLEHSRLHGYRDATAQLGRAEVPHGLREAVTERLRALTEAGAAITDSAAVLAVPATEELLTKVAALEPALGAEGLTDALRASILRESDEGHYVFRHVLAQQVAYQHIPGPQRTRLHHRAIEQLRTRQPAPLVQIAHHTLAAGDRETWYRRAEEAADQATTLGDTGTAAALLHQILEQPRTDTDLRSRAALTLARIVVNGVDYTASAAALRRILADPQLPEASRGEVRLGLGLLMVNHAGDRSGVRELETAVQELTTRPERAARAMTALAQDERIGGFEQALAWLDRAEQAVRESPDEAIRATVQATRLTLLADAGDPSVWDQLDQLPRRSDVAEVLRQTVRALFNCGDGAIGLGHDRRARALITESRELAPRVGTPVLDCYSRVDLLRLDFLAGRWEGIEERFAALTAEYPDISLADAEQTMLHAELAHVRGRYAQALELFKEAADQGRRDMQVNRELRAAAGMAGTRLAQQAPEDAWAVAAPAVAVLQQAETWALYSSLVPVAVEAALASGHRHDAQQLTTDAEHGLHGADSPAGAANLHSARAILLRADEPDRAAEHFAHSRRRWQEIGRPYEAARAAEHLAETLVHSHRADAAAHLSEAIDTYTRLGATADLARCQHTQHELGLAQPAGRGRRGYGGQLSPREHQVAELLVQRATNQDIAETLFLSPRTVEHHVAQVLKKLHTTRKAVHEVYPDEPSGT
ncbi:MULTISPECIES: AAA family ATPase [unclassified Kitasatospora]|uniref:ATP-binding protein n=1 Tax=unclassified Kitasatospora TaxID=2633591 RepID=UPI00070EAF9D|nr:MULTISPECIES: LuxR family transcriptional regulator [unclassified Kitasatospora]KQV12443.1 LuxR family transcriptional regulator [Kitasatospora sp. Root107]KRB66942.1 LuxR family transcriptional regulator [Kitasatospora sp. Root187]